MDTVQIIAQAIIGLGIYNVWLLRFRKPSIWRSGDSKTMKEEFHVYGLPEVALYIVGFLKLIFATLLLIGIWVPALVSFAALGMCILMAGAVAMHLKARDPVIKLLPASGFLILSIIVLLVSY